MKFAHMPHMPPPPAVTDLILTVHIIGIHYSYNQLANHLLRNVIWGMAIFTLLILMTRFHSLPAELSRE